MDHRECKQQAGPTAPLNSTVKQYRTELSTILIKIQATRGVYSKSGCFYYHERYTNDNSLSTNSNCHVNVKVTFSLLLHFRDFISQRHLRIKIQTSSIHRATFHQHLSTGNTDIFVEFVVSFDMFDTKQHTVILFFKTKTI